jgi:rhodanese-related sulfurtransferase
MTTPTVATLVAEAKGQIENLTPEQVAKELEQGDTVLVDLRESEELQSTGRIPGAVHIPRGMLEFAADTTSPYHQGALDPAKRVVLHCAAGGRSALAATTLKQMGYSNVAHLDGGITAWTSEGRPTEPA